MSMIRRLMVVSAGLLLSGGWSRAAAQGSCSTPGNANATCTVPLSVAMTIAKTTTLTASSGTSFDLAPSTGLVVATDYDAGAYDVAATMTLTVRSNTLWNATIAASASTFNASCSTKPATDLLWGRTSTTRATPMSTTTANAFTSASNAATASAVQNLFFRMTNIGWTTDAAGVCALGMTFSVQTL
jgi:hypothetical protein